LLVFGGLDHRHAELLAEGLELFASGHPVWVGGDEQWSRAVLTQVERELRGRCGLTGALEADEHDYRRWFGRHCERRLAAAEDIHQLFVDDGNDLLRAGQA